MPCTKQGWSQSVDLFKIYCTKRSWSGWWILCLMCRIIFFLMFNCNGSPIILSMPEAEASPIQSPGRILGDVFSFLFITYGFLLLFSSDFERSVYSLYPNSITKKWYIELICWTLEWVCFWENFVFGVSRLVNRTSEYSGFSLQSWLVASLYYSYMSGKTLGFFLIGM